MKSLLSLGFLGLAFAGDAILDSIDESATFSADVSNSMGSSTIVAHNDKGKFSITSTADYVYTGGTTLVSNKPTLGIKLHSKGGDIKNGIQYQYSSSSCDSATEQSFSNNLPVDGNVKCGECTSGDIDGEGGCTDAGATLVTGDGKFNGRHTDASLCDIGFALQDPGSPLSATNLYKVDGCLRLVNDGDKYYGRSDVKIEFLDTGGVGEKTTTHFLSDFAEGLTLRETYVYYMKGKDLGQRSYPTDPEDTTGGQGVTEIKSISGGAATVDFSVDAQIGDGSLRFGSCATGANGYIQHSAAVGETTGVSDPVAPSLHVEHKGSMTAIFTNGIVHSSHLIGAPATLANYAQTMTNEIPAVTTFSETPAGTTGDGSHCRISYTGSILLKFPIVDMHANYWDFGSGCNSCEGKLNLALIQDGVTGTVAGQKWDAAGVTYSTDAVVIPTIGTPTSKSSDAINALFGTWGQSVLMNSLFDPITPGTTTASDLLESPLAWTTPTGVDNCNAVSAVNLYQLSTTDIANYYTTEAAKCSVPYPAGYGAKHTITYIVQTNEFEANIGLADSGFEYRDFGAVTGESLTTASSTAFQYSGSDLSFAQLQPPTCVNVLTQTGADDDDLVDLTDGEQTQCTGALDGNQQPVLEVNLNRINMISAKAFQSADDTGYPDEQCGDIELTMQTTLNVQDKENQLTVSADKVSTAIFSIPPPRDDATEIAASVVAGQLAPAITDLWSAPDILAALPPSIKNLKVQHDSKQVDKPFGRSVPQAQVYSCRASDAGVTYTYSNTGVVLPCGKSAPLSDTLNVKYKFKPADVHLDTNEIAFGTKVTRTESQHNANSSQTSRVVYATSAAILHLRSNAGLSIDIDPDDAAGSTDGDFSAVIGEYEDRVPGDASTGRVPITITYTKAHDNLGNGKNHDGLDKTFKVSSTHNQCDGGGVTVEVGTIAAKFKIAGEQDKYRGIVAVRDTSNSPDTVASNGGESVNAHLGDIEVELNVAINQKDTGSTQDHKRPTFEVILNNQAGETSGTDTKVSWHTSEIEWVGGNAAQLASSVYRTELSVNGFWIFTFRPAEDLNRDLLVNDASLVFTLTIEQNPGTAEATTRDLKLSVKNTEPPHVLEVRDIAYTSTAEGPVAAGNPHLFIDNNDEEDFCSESTEACYGGADSHTFSTITFDMRVVPDSEYGHVSDATIAIAAPADDVSAQSSLTISGRKIGTAEGSQDGGYQQVSITTKETCQGPGQFQVTLGSVVSIINFHCRRHATNTPIVHTVLLDYGLDLDATSTAGKLTFDQSPPVNGQGQTDAGKNPFGTTDTVYAGVACGASASTLALVADKCKGDGLVVAPGSTIKQLVDKFDACGAWDVDKDSTGGVDQYYDSGSMTVIRQYVFPGQKYCQSNSLGITLFKKGTAAATIIVKGLGNADFSYTVSQLEYVACSGDDEGKFDYRFNLTGSVVSDSNSENPYVFTTHGHSNTLSTPLAYTSANGQHVTGASGCQDFCGASPASLINGLQAISFTATQDVNGVDIRGYIQANLQISGSPCGDADVDADIASAGAVDIELAFIPEGDDCATATVWKTDDLITEDDRPTIDQRICAKMKTGIASYAVQIEKFTFTNSGTSADKSKSLANGDDTGINGLDDQFYYETLDSNAVITVDVIWTYKINGRRMLRTASYTLGSSAGESHASIQILPAGVQIQEQIEAAPAHDVIYNGTVLNTTETSLPDHQHTNANWGLGLGIGGSVVGVGFIAVWIYTGWKRTENGRDFLGVGSGYRKVGRFETNMAF